MGFLDVVKNALKGVVTAPAPTVAAEPVRPAPTSTEPTGTEVTGTEQTGTEPEAAPTFTTYTIRTGDTLGDIGARHGVSREELARLNGIDEPDLLFPGQELRIPTS
jgi:LysM repeat protein